ncbi:MAG: hypothetical protein LBC84_03100 [Prevotellaceae bacterium]|nr:hypothetical protein [Prevotellaceae bacterium]
MKTVKNEHQMPTEQELELRMWALERSYQVFNANSYRGCVKDVDSYMELAWKIHEFLQGTYVGGGLPLHKKEVPICFWGKIDGKIDNLIELTKQK